MRTGGKKEKEKKKGRNKNDLGLGKFGQHGMVSLGASL